MADPVLIERVRDLAAPGLVEKTVFGARCWVLDGNLAFGVHDDDLLVRLGPGVAADERMRAFDPMGGGRPMKGWFLVGQDEVAEDDELDAWLEKALGFTRTLPPK